MTAAERAAQFAAWAGVRYPILNAPMADIAGPELAAAVSEAGGLGVLAADFYSADDIRRAVATVRRLTNKPFAVHVRAETLRPLDTAEVNRMNEALAD